MIDIQTIFITPEILNLITEIDEFKGIWQYLGKLDPARLSTLKKVATIESIGSSTRIEGSNLSDREVELLLTRVSTYSFQSRDEQEVVSYAFACEKIFEHYQTLSLTENHIKQLHTWLLQYSDKDERHRGSYKKMPIRIEAFNDQGKSVGVIFESISPMETPIRMEELIQWTNQALQEKILHPLITISLFIVIFLVIHPFQDGNGRLSRLLTTLLMMKAGYSYVLYSSLESIIEANKESYYLALQKTQASWLRHEPNWMPWLLFFLNCLAKQKHHLQVKVSREKMLMQELPKLSKHIIELLEAHGQLKINDFELLTNANRNTLKKALASLVKSQHLSIHGKGKASWYTL